MTQQKAAAPATGQPVPKADEPPIKIAGLEQLLDEPKVVIEKAGDVVVEEFKPTAEQLANLNKTAVANKISSAPQPVLEANPTGPNAQQGIITGPAGYEPGAGSAPATAPGLVSGGMATRTMQELERGRAIIEAKTRERNARLG